MPCNFTKHLNLPASMVTYDWWCRASSLNNHKLLQFLQHSTAPLVCNFSFSHKFSFYETFSPPYILSETKDSHLWWSWIGNKGYLTWLLWFLFIMKVVHVLKRLRVVSSCTGTQRNETLTNCVTTPCMDMKTIGIPPYTGTPGQPPITSTWSIN